MAQKDPQRLEQLRNILLSEDRESLQKIQAVLEDKEQLSERVSPIVEEHITYLKNNFPVEFRQVVDEQIQKKLKDSQEEILGVIYPVLGRMIRKYITHQFQMLKESIDQKIKSTFSRQRFFGFFQRKKAGEEILSEIDKPVIEEVYLIQRDSGLLLGSASEKETIDQDVVAGMFTAIKAFVEDAFQREKEELEMIEYDHYKIFIQNFPAYYMAIAISGSISAKEKDELSTRLLKFAEKELLSIPKVVDSNWTTLISKKLTQYFFSLEIS